MQIQDGVRYLRRDGEVTGKMRLRHGSEGFSYPWLDQKNLRYYTPDGHYHLLEKSKFDLIAPLGECDPKVSPAPTAPVVVEAVADGGQHPLTIAQRGRRLEQELGLA